MRELTGHKGGVLNDELCVESVGGRGAGGAHMIYRITSAVPGPGSGPPIVKVAICFQEGDPQTGVDGISDEALLAIVEDRLAGFQAGPFSCDEYARALLCVTAALNHLHSRTAARQRRGVEGKATP